jgi:hypothetical protein
VANPLSRRLLQLAGLLSLLLIAVVVNYLLHEKGEVLSPFAEAAQRTEAQPGARLKIAVSYTVAGKVFSGSGDGDYNARTGRTDSRLTISLPGGPTFWSESVGDTRNVYTRSSQLGALLPPGKMWLGMQPLLGRDPSNSFSSGLGAKSAIEMLKAAGGDVEQVDHQIVRGHRTTRYKATVDLAQMAEVLRGEGEGMMAHAYEKLEQEVPAPMPIELWIDERGLARLVRVVMPLSAGDGKPTVTMDLRMEFFDFGAHPHIEQPPKRKVFDYTPVLRAELGLEDGRVFGPPTPPPGAAPLSSAAFRRRVDDVCRRTYDDLRALLPHVRRLEVPFRGLDRGAVEAGAARPLYSALGRWLEQRLYPLAVREHRELRALAPPAPDAALYQRYLTLNAKEGEWFLAQSRVWELGAAKVPNSDGHEGEEKRNMAERKRLERTLGIPGCGKEPDMSGSGSAAQVA